MPSSYTNVGLTKPDFLSTGSWSPQDDRKPFTDMISPGVVGIGDYLITFSSVLTLSMAPGVAWIRGQNVADQGMYRQYESATKTIAVGGGHATLPRLDQIILRVLDQDHDTSGSYQGVLEVIPGTATSGATLANRSGATDLTTLLNGSKNVLLLSDVLVPAGASSITSANVGDKRVRATMPGNIIVPYAHAYRTTNLSIPTGGGTDTAIGLDAERDDNDAIHDNATNNSRLTCKTPGVYDIKGCIEWAANATGQRVFKIRLNGTTFISIVSDFPDANPLRQNVSMHYRLAVGDYVELTVSQTSGGALNVTAAGNYSPEFSMARIAA